MSHKILVINPGSTSTKIGVFEDEKLLFDKTLRHSAEEIAQFPTIADQKDFRKKLVLEALAENHFDMKELSAVCGRGGLMKSIPGGTYQVTTSIVVDLVKGVQGQHASNLGGILAREIADELDIPAYIVDPPVVDEMSPVAKYSGHPLIQRRSKFHALNQKAVAKRYAKEHGTSYDQLNLIVCHMGGGVSVGAHVHGKVVDVENALDGDGPFSPERAGSLPTGDLVSLCFSGEYTEPQIRRMLAGGGGMVAYFGAQLQMGIETVLDTVGFDALLDGADMVFSGEGKIDFQSLLGKVVIGVARRTKRAGVPLIAVVGDIGDNIDAAYEAGVSAIFSINRVAVPYQQARTRAKNDLALTMDNLMRFFTRMGL